MTLTVFYIFSGVSCTGLATLRQILTLSCSRALRGAMMSFALAGIAVLFMYSNAEYGGK